MSLMVVMIEVMMKMLMMDVMMVVMKMVEVVMVVMVVMEKWMWRCGGGDEDGMEREATQGACGVCLSKFYCI